jgi:bacterioferritin-associated ferredoxin
MNEDHVICWCCNIKDSEIKAVIKENNCQDFQEVRKYSCAGTHCGACVGTIQDLCDRSHDE